MTALSRYQKTMDNARYWIKKSKKRYLVTVQIDGITGSVNLQKGWDNAVCMGKKPSKRIHNPYFYGTLLHCYKISAEFLPYISFPTVYSALVEAVSDKKLPTDRINESVEQAVKKILEQECQVCFEELDHTTTRTRRSPHFFVCNNCDVCCHVKCYAKWLTQKGQKETGIRCSHCQHSLTG